MDKKAIASGAAAVVLATGLALTPAVTDTEVMEPEVIEEVVIEETEVSEDIEEVTEESSETEKTETEETKTEEPVITEPKQPHLEAEKPTYEDYTTEIGYSFTQASERSKTITIDVPEYLSADIVTMYVNGAEVNTVLLPGNPNFTTIPVVFEDLSNIEFKLYRMGEEIGSAKFIDDILKTNAKAVE
ncbi:MAG: hypothetical protein IJ454_03050 [Clostridia bacterium]|nr:hypothetical protein [Clostridia bacterium]